jgi:O-antigen ligase
MISNQYLEKTYHYLILSLAFLMPITVFGANIFVAAITILFLVSGNYKSKFQKIINNKLLLASIIFFSLHVVGIIWTEDIAWGLHIIHKMWYFVLFFPILFSIVQKKHLNLYIGSFLLAILLSLIISYLVWFGVIDSFKAAHSQNPTPFMSHIQYNPILACAIYIVLHKILFNKNLNKLQYFFHSIFSLSMIVNMFITGGRSGQVMFFGVLVILMFQYFPTNKIKALFTSLSLVCLIFFTAFQQSDIFHSRVNEVVQDIKDYDSRKNTSVGLRIAFSLNSLEIIKNNLIFGVGTGDFPSEYEKINQKNTPDLPNTTNPHNMYILVLMQLGIIGLLSFLSIFYFQIRFAISNKAGFLKDFGLALPLLYLIIMLGDSYLLGHYTSLMYVLFSAFLYKDFNNF